MKEDEEEEEDEDHEDKEEDTGALGMIAKLLVARFTVLKKGGYGRTDGPTVGSTDQQTAGPTNGPLIEMRGRI